MNTRKIYVAAIILAALLAYVGPSHASGNFRLRSLRGVYGFSGSGTLFDGSVQAAIVGLNSFDGAGGCDITARLNAGGTVFSLTAATCTYTVNSNGTGLITATFNEPGFTGPFMSDFVIVDQGKELQFVLSDVSQTTVASGVAKRQSSSDRD